MTFGIYDFYEGIEKIGEATTGFGVAKVLQKREWDTDGEFAPGLYWGGDYIQTQWYYINGLVEFNGPVLVEDNDGYTVRDITHLVRQVDGCVVC